MSNDQKQWAGRFAKISEEVALHDIAAHLTRAGWNYVLDRKDPSIITTYDGEHGKHQLSFSTDTDTGELSARARLFKLPDSNAGDAAIKQMIELNKANVPWSFHCCECCDETFVKVPIDIDAGYQDFCQRLELLTAVVDREYPKLMRLLWAPPIKDIHVA
jgi:hypothetical protein